ncbi:quinol monooxygenase YgiN [Paenibacillus cellulosilyticus]|uniref:Quinol monooxygenase YgiN n=1 Tax=Paenibacillus cellulosilyticus TaxID=375489 RepID=A0A2V2Z4R1_9BACL|nr:putative quinol monooxygenase [Paenibacillus cellulosilyticus]PWW05459.1 quinol monooxygenase YgiN [Paenibacillus cellulosilyticus]QKS45501.1 antibiotic biosynthesis monooxygenase [Paenibacillus cellulosilyticus]
MLIVHAHLQVIPEQEEAFLEAAKTLLPASRSEEGNIAYNLMKSTERDHHYTMVELWRDQAAIASHNASEHFQQFVKQASTFMAAPMDLQVFAGERV